MFEGPADHLWVQFSKFKKFSRIISHSSQGTKTHLKTKDYLKSGIVRFHASGRFLA